MFVFAIFRLQLLWVNMTACLFFSTVANLKVAKMFLPICELLANKPAWIVMTYHDHTS